MTKQSSRTRVRFTGASALTIALALASQVPAREAAAQETAAPDSVEEVIVTGSRVARAGFLAPTPTTVVSATILNTNASTNIGGVLNTLPSFKADYSPAASGPRSFGSPGATFANLRSLGSQRTLTLLDGRRMTPSSVDGQADLNLVPSLLIDTVDVVTGGASAAYGSDAVAGVVNVRLKKRLEGFLGNFSYGQSAYDDMKDTFAALAWGTGFAGGKGHVMVGAEYDRNRGADSAYARPWGRDEWGLIPNPAGSPAQLLVMHRHTARSAPGGLVQSGPLKGTVFLPNGQTRQYQYGNPVSGSFQVGGEGGGDDETSSLLMNPLKRRSVLGRFDYELSSRLSVFAEAALSKTDSFSRGSSPTDTTGLTIRRNNAYLPASIAARMDAARVTSLAVGRRNDDLGIYQVDVRTKVQRYVAGAEGSLGGGWRWDAYAQYGRTDYHGGVLNARNQAKWRLGVDAVVNPANGQVVCASTLANPTNGCVPINIFGIGSISDAARRYVMGDEALDLRYQQSVVAFNLRGSPFSTWAGEVSVAAGAEHRYEKVVGVPDAVSAVGGWHTGNQRGIRGGFQVTEGYVEALTPLLADHPLARLVELDTAVRLTDYSTSGRVTTWKVGLNYELNDQIRFRAARSRDIRAASMNELFAEGVSAQQPIFDPTTNITNNVTNLTVGNRNLTPEKADTWTAGVVLKPAFAPGLDLSIDRYDIRLKDAISSLTGQRIVDLCYAGSTALCPLITRTGGAITQVTRATFNLNSIRASGYDFEVRYRTGLEGVFGPRAGALTMRYIGTRTEHLTVDDLNSVIDYAGDVGSSGRGAFGQPKWRWSLLTTYDNGPFSGTATVRYVGGGKLNNTWTAADIADNRVKSATYVDLSLSYNLLGGARMAQLYGTVQNLFDKAPPVAPTQVSQTNPVIYDTFGRLYRAGVRLRF